LEANDPVAEDKTQAAKAAQKVFQDPYEFLATLPEAPTRQMVDSWKAQAPNHRIRIFAPDGKRVFIVRAIGGYELQKLQAALPQNLGSGLPPEQAARPRRSCPPAPDRRF